MSQTASVGIDISGVQPDSIPGDWRFVVVKTTEGTSVVNPRASAQWAFAHGFDHRGLYHYARPAKFRAAGNAATAIAQANAFANDALARGFRKGVDLWQLDCEGQENDWVTSAGWSAFVPAFMDTATAKLGPVGFVYVGRYFHWDAFGPLVARYPWWLPDYGVNNGQVHSLPPGVNPVIHQFSAAGGLDRNVIANEAKWAAMTNAKPNPLGVLRVNPDYSPPADAQAMTTFEHHNKALGYGGICAALVKPDGAVYCEPSAAYLGGMNGNKDFAGRIAVDIRPPNAMEVAGKNWRQGGYVIVAHTGETYYKGNAK